MCLTVRIGGSITPLVSAALESVESAAALILGGCQARMWNPRGAPPGPLTYMWQ